MIRTQGKGREQTLQKSIEALDGKINDIQQGQLENPAQGDINIEKQNIIDMRDEDARKSNMTVYNAKESKEAPRERQRTDTLFILILFKDQIGITEFKEEYILNVIRLGKKQYDKNRPIRVNLDIQSTTN